MDIYLPVKPTILVLENSPESLARIGALLCTQYSVKAVSGGRSVQHVCSTEMPDLILIDTTRPDSQGFEVCKALKADEFTCWIPVIFLTLTADAELQQTFHELGAVDFISRPISPAILLSRIKAHLAVVASERLQRINSESLAFEEARHKKQVTTLQEVTLLALASLAEIRDVKTGNHLKRTQHYIYALGQHLLGHPNFSHYLTLERLNVLFKCAPLHDIGKVGISDRTLLKPGRYEPAEFEVMKAHPKLGFDAIVQAQHLAGDRSEFLEIAKEIVYGHHEKWDGSGYPQGLAGNAIPISARLMAMADVYDALISERVYKKGMSHAQATQLILEGRGKHFDPDIVDAFVALSDVFQGIAARFSDSEHDVLVKSQLGQFRQHGQP